MNSCRIVICGLLACALAFAGGVQALNIADFQLNEENYPGSFAHTSPAVAKSASGNFATVWLDYRTDERDPNYYAQVFNSAGSPVGKNIVVLDKPVGPKRPAIAMRSNGDFVVAYLHGDGVYAQMYYSTGASFGPAVRVAKIEWTTCPYCFDLPTVAMNDAGHIVVAWQQQWPSENTIMAQYLDFSGQLLGTNFTLKSDQPILAVGKMRLAITNQEKIFSCMVEGTSRVLTKIWDYGLTPGAVEDTVADVQGVFGQGLHQQPNDANLCLLPNGTVSVLWKDCHDSTIEVYPGSFTMYSIWYDDHMRIYGGDGVNIAANLPLAPSPEVRLRNCWFSVSVTGDGIAVANAVYNDTLVSVQRYSMEGDPVGSQVTIDPQVTTGAITEFELISFGNDHHVLVWQCPGISSKGDIYRQKFSMTGSSIGPALRVHDDIGAIQITPRVVKMADGSALCLWIDYRNNLSGELYGQVFDPGGQKRGNNFKMVDSGGVYQYAVGGNGTDRAVIVWRDGGPYWGGKIYAQRLDNTFSKVGAGITVEDPARVAYDFMGEVGVALDGGFVIAYQSRLGGESRPNVYLKRYSSNGAPLSDKILISVDAAGYYPRIAMRPNGEFGITWQQANMAMFQRFSADCQPLSTAVQTVGANGPCGPLRAASIAVNANNQYAVAWCSEQCSPHSGIHLAMFDSTAHQTMNWTRLPLDYGLWEVGQSTYRGELAVGPDDNFIAFFQDPALSEPSVWARKFNSAGFLTSQIQINSDQTGTVQQMPAIVMIGSTGLFVWEDYRNNRGNTDIFGRYLEWSAITSITGDVDGSGTVDISDLTAMVGYLFLLGTKPLNNGLGDMNGDGMVDVADVTAMVDYLF